MGSALDAVARILADAGEPLHYREIARRVIKSGLWTTDGKTPEATISAQLTVHIKKHGAGARFRRVGSGTFALNESAAQTEPGKSEPPPSKNLPAAAAPVSFTDAVEEVLTRHGGGQPMHYRNITAKALKLGLIRTSGRTPEATMYGSVLEEIQRYRKRGQQPRFHMPGKGMIGLAKSLPIGIPSQVDQHNRRERSHPSGRRAGRIDERAAVAQLAP